MQATTSRKAFKLNKNNFGLPKSFSQKQKKFVMCIVVPLLRKLIAVLKCESSIQKEVGRRLAKIESQ